MSHDQPGGLALQQLVRSHDCHMIPQMPVSELFFAVNCGEFLVRIHRTVAMWCVLGNFRGEIEWEIAIE